MQSLAPFPGCSVSNLLIKTVPLLLDISRSFSMSIVWFLYKWSCNISHTTQLMEFTFGLLGGL